MVCPKCGSTMVQIATIPGKGTSEVREFRCQNCGHVETVLYRNGQVDTGR